MMSFPQSVIDSLAGINLKPATIYAAAATTTVTPSILLVSQVILPANPNRKGVVLYNNSANSVYICFGATATSAGCHKILATFATWEWYGPAMYVGVLSAIRNAGVGVLNIVELT